MLCVFYGFKDFLTMGHTVIMGVSGQYDPQHNIWNTIKVLDVFVKHIHT